MSKWLMHFGIKGQKWGVRRFRNYDGTLTEIGERRYGTLKTAASDYMDYRKYKYRKLSDYNKKNADAIKRHDEAIKKRENIASDDEVKVYETLKKNALKRKRIGQTVGTALFLGITMRNLWNIADFVPGGAAVKGKIKMGVHNKAVDFANSKTGDAIRAASDAFRNGAKAVDNIFKKPKGPLGNWKDYTVSDMPVKMIENW